MPKEFDELRLKIKKQLIKDGSKEEDAETRSWAIATAQWKKTHGGKAPTENFKRDEQGRKIIAENIKLNFTSDLIRL